MSEAPVIRINTQQPAPEVKREPLFYIDDTEYTIPVEIAPNVAVAYIRDVAVMPMEMAVARLMIDVLGQQAVDALAGCEHLGRADWDKIQRVVVEKTMGQVEQEGN